MIRNRSKLSKRFARKKLSLKQNSNDITINFLHRKLDTRVFKVHSSIAKLPQSDNIDKLFSGNANNSVGAVTFDKNN
jgi:hypothetical protein